MRSNEHDCKAERSPTAAQNRSDADAPWLERAETPGVSVEGEAKPGMGNDVFSLPTHCSNCVGPKIRIRKLRPGCERIIEGYPDRLISKRRVNSEGFAPAYRRMLIVSDSHFLALAEFANVVVINHRLRIALNGDNGCGAVGRAGRQPGELYVLVALLKGYGFAGSKHSRG